MRSSDEANRTSAVKSKIGTLLPTNSNFACVCRWHSFHEARGHHVGGNLISKITEMMDNMRTTINIIKFNDSLTNLTT